MIQQIISGCQIGADQGGLFAAEEFGIKTGGFVTKGNKTLEGLRPDLITRFNLTELDGVGYKERTWMNVQNSDGTIRFATDFNSPGEKCTLNGIKHFNKPYIDIDILKHEPFEHSRLILIKKIVDWVLENDIKVLNVAGNADSRITIFVKATMLRVLRGLNT